MPVSQNIAQVIISQTLSEISIGPEDTFSVAGSSISAEKLAKLLNGIRAIVLLNHVAAGADPVLASQK
jgi:hypothetical protein